MYQDPTGQQKKDPSSSVITVLVVVFVLLVLYIMIRPMYHPGCPARKAGCQSNLVQIGKACKMYSGDWDDKLPTNRWKDSEHRQFLSNACRLSETDSHYARTKYSDNYIEALQPYVGKLEDSGTAAHIWSCQKASEKTYPKRWSARAATSTYCMNWYAAEKLEGEFRAPSITLLFREMDRRTHALLRPHPRFPPDARHPRGWGPPLYAFPSRNEFGTNDVDTERHTTGSNVLFADGHVMFFPAEELLATPVFTNKLHDGTRMFEGRRRWRVGEILISP